MNGFVGFGAVPLRVFHTVYLFGYAFFVLGWDATVGLVG